MKTVAAILVGLIVAVLPASAQFNGAPVGFSGVRAATASSSFVGDGDQVTGARAYYGVLAYNGAYAAASGKMLSVVRTSDGHACDIMSATNGMLGNTADCGNTPDNGLTATSFCAATTCQVATAYDMSGNGLDATQGTSASQPTLVFNCSGSVPCMRFLGTSTQKLAANIATAMAQPYTLLALARVTHSTTGDLIIAGGNTFPTRISMVNSFSNGINGAAGSLLASPVGATVNTFLPMTFVANNTTSNMSVGGISSVGPASTQSFPPSNGTPLTLGSDGGNEGPLTGDIIVAGAWPAGFTTSQITSVCLNQQTNAGVPCYAGPGDVVQASVVAYYGLTAYSSAVAASGSGKAVNIVRASDGHACDVLIALSGNLGVTTGCGTGGDSGQSASAFCASTTCAVATAYQQSGGAGGNATQATGANRPTLSFNCINTSQPCMTFSGSQWLSATATTGTASSWSMIGRRTANFTTQQAVFNGFTSGNNMLNFFGTSTNTVGMSAGTSQTVTATDGSFHSLQIAYNAAASFINADGTTTTLSPGTATSQTTVTVGAVNGGASQQLSGDVQQAGLWGLVFTTTQSLNMCHLQTFQMGISGSC